MKIARQGDTLYIYHPELQSIAGNVIPRVAGRIIVAAGEVTGHHHAISTADVTFIERDSIRWLVAPQEFVVAHEEHKPLVLESGVWEIVYQYEYEPQELRRITD